MSETRSLGCAGCGDCCDEIYLSGVTLVGLRVWTTEALVGVPDPRTDEGWEWWKTQPRDDRVDRTWSNEWRDVVIDRYDPVGSRRLNADFLTEHWHPIENKPDAYSCDAFDSVHRRCTAYEERPPVCSGYPWYDEAPTSARITRTGSRCSYLLDLPPVDRPEGARPLIPIEVIQR